MYNNKNVDFGEQEVITSIPFDNGNSLKVSKVTYKNGARAVDIRRWYTKDGAEAPSPKGVRIEDENITEVLKAVIKAMSTEAIYDLAGELNKIVENLEDEDDDTEEDDEELDDYDESEDIM